MAAAFWERLGGDARSAGSAPADTVNPAVVDAMRERGIDLSKCVPRRLNVSDARWADIVVTMGCGDVCPTIPGKRYLEWQLDDPAGQGVESIRRIRDELEARVRRLAESSIA